MMWPKDRTRQMLLMSLWVFLHHQLSVVHGLSTELACSPWTQASMEAPHVSPCPRGWLCKAELMAQRKIETFSKHTLYHKGAPNFEGFFFFCILYHMTISCLMTELLQTVPTGNFQTNTSRNSFLHFESTFLHCVNRNPPRVMLPVIWVSPAAQKPLVGRLDPLVFVAWPDEQPSPLRLPARSPASALLCPRAFDCLFTRFAHRVDFLLKLKWKNT